MRTIPALAVSTTVLIALTGCAGGPFGSACTPIVDGGPASTLVTATGEVGAAPDVDFPTPIITDDVEATSIVTGDGATVTQGDTVTVKYSLYNAATGASLGSSGYGHNGDLLTVGSTNTASVISDSLECVTVGSRVAIVASADIVHGGQGDASIGVGPNDSILYVIDVLDAIPGKASGAPQLAERGLPTIVTAPDGTPGITIPRAPAPTEVATATLIAGDGETLEADDRLFAKYTSVAWETRSVVDSTWSNGRGSVIPLDGSGSLPQPVIDALIGTTLGSQVLVVVPAGELGDGATRTVVYVIDALGVLPANN